LSVASALAGAWITHVALALAKAAAPSCPAALERGAPDQGAPSSTEGDRAAPPPALPLDQLRSVLREEIDRALDGHRAAQEDPQAPAKPPATPEQTAAFGRAADLLHGARDRQHWTEQDRDKLRSLLPQLAPQDLAEVLHTLVPALNRGEIQIDFKGPPF
jgi:hypothetical protein